MALLKEILQEETKFKPDKKRAENMRERAINCGQIAAVYFEVIDSIKNLANQGRRCCRLVIPESFDPDVIQIVEERLTMEGFKIVDHPETPGNNPVDGYTSLTEVKSWTEVKW